MIPAFEPDPGGTRICDECGLTGDETTISYHGLGEWNMGVCGLHYRTAWEGFGKWQRAARMASKALGRTPILQAYERGVVAGIEIARKAVRAGEDIR